MTTATGDVVFDFKAISPSPASPYTLPAGLNAINGPFQIVDNTIPIGGNPATGTALKMLYSDDGIAAFVITNPATSGVLTARIEQQNTSSITGDLACPAVLDASGNGYMVGHTLNTIYIWRVDAYIAFTSGSLGSGPSAFAAGDVLGISVDLGTGAISATVNGSQVATATDTTYDTGLAQGYIGVWSNTNAAGVLSFGASGIAGGGPTTNPGLRLRVKDRLGAEPANDTNYSVVVRAAINSTSNLYATSTAAIVSGVIEIDSDAVGSVGAVVYVAIGKQGATIAQDKNAAGRATVVDLNTAYES